MRGLNRILILIASLGLTSCADADVGQLMEGYLWEKRVLLVFSRSYEHVPYQMQTAMITPDLEGVEERDLVIWVLVADKMVSVDGEVKAHLATQPFYDYFNVRNDSFATILLGKDGEEKLRQNAPIDSATLFELMDAMPMRQQEILQGIGK